MPMNLKMIASVGALAVLGACANKPGSAPAAGSSAGVPSDVRIVKSRDGRFDGEMIGTPTPGSKFSRLQIGMQFNEVTKLIGGPTNMHTSETGKRWIPFYFGNDATRLQADYSGEGCLTFTGGSVFGGGTNELIRITADPSGSKCVD